MLLMLLVRDTFTTEETLGVMTIFERRLQTIEKPWIPNANPLGKAGAPFISCIPPGLYKVERFTRPSGEKALILSAPDLGVYQKPWDIPPALGKAGTPECLARALCLVHAANWAHELHGCIGPGFDRKKESNGWMVRRSREAMNLIRTVIGSELDIKLKIEEKR